MADYKLTSRQTFVATPDINAFYEVCRYDASRIYLSVHCNSGTSGRLSLFPTTTPDFGRFFGGTGSYVEYWLSVHGSLVWQSWQVQGSNAGSGFTVFETFQEPVIVTGTAGRVNGGNGSYFRNHDNRLVSSPDECHRIMSAVAQLRSSMRGRV